MKYFLIWIGSLSIYFFSVGVASVIMKKCMKKKNYDIVFAAFWPLTVPYFLGKHFVNKIVDKLLGGFGYED